MKFFPENALTSLEFEKIKHLLLAHCRTELAKSFVQQLRVHTKIEFIQKEISQTNEFKIILDSGLYFPNDFNYHIQRDLKLLSLSGAVLTGEQFILILKLVINTENIFRWFDDQRKEQFSQLADLLLHVQYEKSIRRMIEEVMDPHGVLKDNASDELFRIRMALYRKRHELRKEFEKIVGKLNKQGYLADIEESFMNGRRVLAVYAEHKRTVKGILHSESDSRRTSFIEPEETMLLNNEVLSLENEESKEVYRILRQLTQDLSQHAHLLQQYFYIAGNYDFIRAKAAFAIEINGQLPLIHDKAGIKLINAFHPLLLLHNNKLGKATIPTHLCLDADQRILLISGPNAGGKTITMKTLGLLQVMMQAGLLIPVSPDSEMGVFKQMMIHIGDTQSIEFELSTYSSHLLHMKYFIEHANGKTMFFIDELGGGSDPNLGGAFAEVIMEELAHKHAMGIVTTHYLNLKIMAGKTKGIFNGAMQFDEENMKPLYQLKIGSPGSSYTFSIAERIGLDKKLINRAKKLADQNQYQLEKLLNQSERELQEIQKEREALKQTLTQNEQLKKGMQQLIKKEQHYQEIEKMKLSNQITEEKLQYLKETERKIKVFLQQWRKSENKENLIREMNQLFNFGKEKLISNKQAKRKEMLPEPIKGDIVVGSYVRMGQTRQTGWVKEIKGKKAFLQVGNVPITTELKNLILVKEPEKN